MRRSGEALPGDLRSGGRTPAPSHSLWAGLRRLVLERRIHATQWGGAAAECADMLFGDCASTGGEGPPVPREPAYADKPSQDGEAPSASE